MTKDAREAQVSRRVLSRFTAGLVGQPFGLEGFVKVKTLSGETAHLLRLSSMLLRKNGVESVRRVESAREDGRGGCLVRFAGFDTPEAAKALSGSEIIVDRKDAAPLAPGEYYAEDLKGLLLVGEGGAPLYGVVTGIIEAGGGNMLETRLVDGGGRSADSVRLVPFRAEFVGDVDLEKGFIILLAPWVLE